MQFDQWLPDLGDDFDTSKYYHACFPKISYIQYSPFYTDEAGEVYHPHIISVLGYDGESPCSNGSAAYSAEKINSWAVKVVGGTLKYSE